MHHGSDGCGPAEVVSAVGDPGSEVPDQAAEVVDGGALVDRCAELELLWRHEAVGAEHLSHRVQVGLTLVAVKVDDGELAGVEVNQQASVVEFGGDPTDIRELLVEVDDAVEVTQELVRCEVSEALVCGPGVSSPDGGCADQLSGSVVVDQRRSEGGFDQLRSCARQW